MTLHKLYNAKDAAVPEMLQGVVALNSNACMLDGVDQVSATEGCVLCSIADPAP